MPVDGDLPVHIHEISRVIRAVDSSNAKWLRETHRQFVCHKRKAKTGSAQASARPQALQIEKKILAIDVCIKIHVHTIATLAQVVLK